MPFGCEFANDISIGGQLISGCKKGYLSVWVLSNSGRVNIVFKFEFIVVKNYCVFVSRCQRMLSTYLCTRLHEHDWQFSVQLHCGLPASKQGIM